MLPWLEKVQVNSIISNVRGLLFKIIDFLYNRSKVFDRVLHSISLENIFFSLSFDV